MFGLAPECSASLVAPNYIMPIVENFKPVIGFSHHPATRGGHIKQYSPARRSRAYLVDQGRLAYFVARSFVMMK